MHERVLLVDEQKPAAQQMVLELFALGVVVLAFDDCFLLLVARCRLFCRRLCVVCRRRVCSEHGPELLLQPSALLVQFELSIAQVGYLLIDVLDADELIGHCFRRHRRVWLTLGWQCFVC